MITIKETFKVLPKKLISQTYFILFFSIIVFFIEILGIGVFLPLLKILTDQNFIADNEKISNFILIFSFFDLNFSNFDEENIKRIKIIIGGIIIIIIVFFLKFIILTFHAYCLLRYRADIQAYLSSQLLKKYTKVSLNYYFFKNSSELLRNITTDVSHYSTTLMSILTIIAEIPIFIGIAIILLTQQPFSSLIALILFSIIIFLLYQSVKKNSIIMVKIELNTKVKGLIL